ncbi:MAG TPA: SPOR domain-containing protein [Lysobacter sp.]|nr:SPOR domain-containing protein [Lysobacter sp.]
MAAKRGKTQARRSGGGGGNGGMPGWAWLVIGVAVTLLVVVAAPRLMDRQKEGFFRPTPNPDAQPQAVNEDAVVDEAPIAEAVTRPKPEASPDDAKTQQDFDFYTLLPGKEVPMTDAELAASEQAEKARQATAANATAATPAMPAPATATDARPLPSPVDEGTPRTAATETRPATPASATPATSAAAAEPADDTRYILQAGAFQASGQAEELKAKIALLGLGARVESAQIGGKTVYRVRMGPYGTAGELAEAKRKLASGGLSAMAVKTQ